MNSKKLNNRKNKRNNKRNNKTKRNTKLKSRKSVKKTVKYTSGKHKKQNQRHQQGGEPEYLKVEGMKLPDLNIPDQYGLLFDN